MSLACMRVTNNFHPNHFALKQRLGATRKWPINLVHLHSELVVMKALVVLHGFSVNYVFFFSFFFFFPTFWSTTTHVDWKTVCFFFFHNMFSKDAKGRREIFAESARASHALRPSLTLRFHPLVPNFWFDRSRALLTSAKIRAVS